MSTPNQPQSPLDFAIEDLARHGYEVQRMGLLVNPDNTDAYHVCQIGRLAQRHVIIICEHQDKTYRFYVPVMGNLTEQGTSLAAWLAENSE